MLLLYLQDYNARALRELAGLCRACFGMDWETRVEACVVSPDELLPRIKKEDAPALFILADAERGHLDQAVARIREQNNLHYIVLVLDSAMDALQIRPPFYRLAGFLLRPVEKETLYRLLENIYRDFSAVDTEHTGFFPVKTRGTVYPVPYGKILFFESLSKKIMARTHSQEYEFYGSLEEISQTAPSFFLRIHKSFCVNVKQILTVNYPERMITMSDESVIPFSRTFKPDLVKAMARPQG